MTATITPMIDTNGKRVLAFGSKVINLARVAELTDAIVDIALSDAWRDYHLATGHQKWREAELDYFLIASGLHYDDVSRVLAWNQKSKELAPLMDSKAEPETRRSIEEAGADWHSPTGQTLIERAAELGWLQKSGKPRTPPIPERARTQARHGMTFEEHASKERARRIPAQRRRELNALAKEIDKQLADINERRYLIERLKSNGPGRSSTTKTELARWRADAERLNWKATALAAHWGITREHTYSRLKRLKEEAQ